MTVARDEFATRALEEGRLDEAIRHLSESARDADDRRQLFHVLTLRGRYDDAAAVLRQDLEAAASAEPLRADDLRERGNAAWRADRLSDALDDLREALRVEADPSKAKGIEGDVAVLEDQIRSMKLVESQLRDVNAASAVVGGLLFLAVLWIGIAARRRRPGRAGPVGPPVSTV
jgi:tetratricopeptide (TPR) repeat protein